MDWLGILGTFPNAMIVSSRSNHTTLEQWLAGAKAARTPLPYGSFGTGSAGHLAGAYLRVEHGANLTHVTVATLDDGYTMLSDGRLELDNGDSQLPMFREKLIESFEIVSGGSGGFR